MEPEHYDLIGKRRFPSIRQVRQVIKKLDPSFRIEGNRQHLELIADHIKMIQVFGMFPSTESEIVRTWYFPVPQLLVDIGVSIITKKQPRPISC